jgi:hypothetical protein
MEAADLPDPPARLLEYLELSDAVDRGWVHSGPPQTQRVKVVSAEWRDYVDKLDAPMTIRSGMTAALDQIEGAGDKVDRQRLDELASGDLSDTSHLACSWFTVMCWGAGPQDRSRLRQWKKAPAWTGFGDALERSKDLCLSGDPVAAYRATKAMPGVGQAFLTKWLWLLGLAPSESDFRGYVLDDKVWKVIKPLGWTLVGNNEAERWVNFSRTLDAWAQTINAGHREWKVDGDRLEHLMFEREEGTSLHKWLTTH